MPDVIPGWRSLYYGTLYENEDPRLVGWGNPPGDPEFSANHPGQGQEQLERVTITLDKDGNPKEGL